MYHVIKIKDPFIIRCFNGQKQQFIWVWDLGSLSFENFIKVGVLCFQCFLFSNKLIVSCLNPTYVYRDPIYGVSTARDKEIQCLHRERRESGERQCLYNECLSSLPML